jgi:hypothetical protein
MTLSTERVRELHTYATAWDTEDPKFLGLRQSLGEDFDAWLAEHDRQISEKRWAEGADIAARTAVILGAPADLPERVQRHNPYRDSDNG